MKTRIFLSVALAAAAFSAPLRADDTGVSVGFSKPGAPRILRVAVPMADLTITGADVDQVTVVSEVAQSKSQKRRDGLRVIATGSSFELSEKDNVVTLVQDHSALQGGPGDFKITVPRDVKVVASVEINGDVRVRGVSGDVSVSNLNGSIDLAGVSGSVSAETMNGEIKAQYASLAPDKVHAFASMNGEIDIYVPADAKATFRLRAQNGTVLTDLDEKNFVTKSETESADTFKAEAIRTREEARVTVDAARVEIDRARAEADRARAEVEVIAPEAEKSGKTVTIRAPKAPRPPRPPRVTFPSFGGQVVTGTLNGGGVEIRATTQNGEIKIRQAK